MLGAIQCEYACYCSPWKLASIQFLNEENGCHQKDLKRHYHAAKWEGVVAQK